MKDYQSKIREAREKVESSQSTLMKIYLDEIRDIYLNLSGSMKRLVIGRLESILEAVETKSDEPIKFDYNKAKLLRVEKALTQRRLGEITGLTNQAISLYEKGSLIPNENTEKSRKYLEWLKDNGYEFKPSE